MKHIYFKLPDKWFVCPETEDNLKVVANYFEATHPHYHRYRITHIENSYRYDGVYSTTKSGLNPDNEITFDQFRKYVLNENIQEVEQDYKYLINIFKHYGVI